MTRTEFLSELEEILEVGAGTINGSERLDALEQWNSSAMIGFIALADSNNGTVISPRQILSCATIDDLVKLARVGE